MSVYIMNDKVKILVVDDSITYRQVLLAVIEKIGDAECVGTAASGSIAINKLRALQPDLLLLDMVMPDMDGVETLQIARRICPEIEAIMVSGFDMNNAKNALRSLQIGALDFIQKPSNGSPENSIAELAQYLRPLIHLVQTKKYAGLSRRRQHPPPIPSRPQPSPASSATPGKIDLIVIGISTGGPRALGHLVPQLPAAMPCPIVIVQHLPPMFTESMATKLDLETPLRVSEAKGGELLAAGHVYIAPGGKHLVLKRHHEGGFCLAVNEDPPVNNCRPSVDVLFGSVAAIFTGNVLAVVMTGMGRDGTEGVRMLKRGSCKCIIQDENSSVVWGMPGSIFDAGLADEVVPLEQLGARIAQLVF
jgi:two-component system chemotaxis response regulator CheB